MQPLRRPAKVQFLGDGDESEKLAGMERRI